MPASPLPKTAPPSPSEAYGGTGTDALGPLLDDIRRCRVCRDAPDGPALPHQPRPVVRASQTARIAICGQAPGTRVHASGIPFSDPSGVRLRTWMGVSDAEFYDVDRIAIVPMGFCFPGLDRSGSDLPPRRECGALWHARLFAALSRLELLVLVGSYAQRWHLAGRCQPTLTKTVASWRDYLPPAPTRTHAKLSVLALPHPSWRNSGWLKAHPWFERELVPALRQEVRRRL